MEECNALKLTVAGGARDNLPIRQFLDRCEYARQRRLVQLAQLYHGFLLRLRPVETTLVDRYWDKQNRRGG